MSFLAAALGIGDHTTLVGFEEFPGGAKLYLGHRYKGVYAVMTDPEGVKEARRAWNGGGHVILPMPPAHAIFTDEDDEIIVGLA